MSAKGSKTATKKAHYDPEKIAVHPRSKQGIPREESVILFDEDKIKALFHLRQQEAAEQLNVCVTSLKRICRSLGIQKWPYEKGIGLQSGKAGTKFAHSTDGSPSSSSISGTWGQDNETSHNGSIVESSMNSSRELAFSPAMKRTNLSSTTNSLASASGAFSLAGDPTQSNELRLLCSDGYFEPEDLRVDADFIESFIAEDDSENEE